MKIKNLFTIKNSILLLAIILLSAGFTPTYAQDTPITVESFAIEGEITDNYANLTYSWQIRNTGSVDKEVSISMEVSEFLYLSNISLAIADAIYWGQVYTVTEAQQHYQDAVDTNETAVLVKLIGAQHQITFNIKTDTSANLTLYFEGFVRRSVGAYTLDLINEYSTSMGSTVNEFSVNLEVTSRYSSVHKANVLGIDSIAQNIAHGKNLVISESNFEVGKLPLSYVMNGNNLDQASLLTYTNGTTNFFAYFYAPEIYDTTDATSREYIFVLDTSGSMSGQRIENAKSAFNNMISTLGYDDYFNVFEFNDQINSAFSGTVSATAENLVTANSWVDEKTAGGSTNINEALQEAFSSFSQEGTTKVLVFLSDGEPTAGSTTDPQKIRENAVSYNVKEATVFSVSVGTQSAEDLMGVLAYDTGGEFMKVTSDTDIVDELQVFYERFNYPVASGIEITYENVVTGPYPSNEYLNGPIFNGTEIVQVGTFENNLNVNATVILQSGNVTISNSALKAGIEYTQVEHIWAIYMIQHLVRLSLINGSPEDKAQITNLALYYQLVIPGYTAITAIADSGDEAYQDQEPAYDRVYDRGPAQAENAPFNSSMVFIALIVLLPLKYIARSRKDKFTDRVIH